jgi:hypothetical protein
MASDNYGDMTQEEPQAQEDLGQQQAAQDQPQLSSMPFRSLTRSCSAECITTVVQVPTGIWTRSIVEPRSKSERTAGMRA